ncbi:hypothetical protein CkaCkLH20_12242 [Colletotrichum karsti]|uniref:Uncharacterized protein n=1 Tax=Colletotrichum karsti TaxID=1095194 RepID=A0A9P6HSV3_9PEZI|nr:uncharacterized protein CkaCkLH20_12242 [Colletotrichum karsti]KAF9870278.1 hypothetical protein CkaCkLH20_12242 [Colletotrichum karsti]
MARDKESSMACTDGCQPETDAAISPTKKKNLRRPLKIQQRPTTTALTSHDYREEDPEIGIGVEMTEYSDHSNTSMTKFQEPASPPSIYEAPIAIPEMPIFEDSPTDHESEKPPVTPRRAAPPVASNNTSNKADPNASRLAKKQNDTMSIAEDPRKCYREGRSRR